MKINKTPFLSYVLQVTSTSLRCLLFILKFPLPALQQHIKAITNHLFILLSNYAAAGAAKGDNLELVIMCFKVGFDNFKSCFLVHAQLLSILVSSQTRLFSFTDPHIHCEL